MDLSYDKICQKLTPYFIENNYITAETPYEIEVIEARKLLNVNRIDLYAKLSYIKNYDLNWNSSFFKDLYCHHIEAFTDGRFKEEGDNNKDSLTQYLHTFDNIIEDIKNNGFDDSKTIVPVGKDNVLLDGAHRTAACAYYNKKITIICFNHLTRKYDLNYFKEHFLQDEYLDYLMIEAIKNDSSIFGICFWPTVWQDDKMDQVLKVVQNEVEVLYKKDLDLTYNGYRNLMIQLYRRHSWLGNAANHYDGVSGQLDPCYKKDSKFQVLFVKGQDLNQILKLKSTIREIFNIGNYSIHSTDNQEETLELANIVLNSNSVFYLNAGRPDAFSDVANHIEQCKNEMFSFKENLVFDSSVVLSMFGIRKSEDLDFLTDCSEAEKFEIEGCDCHNRWAQYYPCDYKELIHNPRYYFTFNDFKFVTLEMVKQYKIQRDEEKDRNDVKLINQFTKNNFTVKFSWIKLKTELKRTRRNTVYHCRQFAKKILIKLGIHDKYRAIIDKRRKK